MKLGGAPKGHKEISLPCRKGWQGDLGRGSWKGDSPPEDLDHKPVRGLHSELLPLSGPNAFMLRLQQTLTLGR